MGIFSRLNTVIKSNLNSMLDDVEDPEKLIGQTVIDMKSEMKRARKELVQTLGAAKRLAKEAAQHEEEADDWERKAVLALKQDDEELAREALKRKAKARKKADDVRVQAQEQEGRAQEMKDTLDQIESKVDELEARKSTLASQVRKARDDSGAVSGKGGGAFADLERMVGRIDQLEAEVEAHDVLHDPEDARVDAAFRELGRERATDALYDELEALKRKLD